MSAEKTVNRLSAGVTLIMLIILIIKIKKFFQKSKLKHQKELLTAVTAEADIPSESPVPTASSVQIFQTLEGKRF